MKIARLAIVAAAIAALAAPAIGTSAVRPVEAIPLSAPAPAWYTPELHRQVLASGTQGVALPESVAIPTSSLAFPGIRPGHLIIVGGVLGAQCTSNFVFRNGGNYAIGTAGHCGKVGQQVTMLALGRVLLNIGNITKSVNQGPGNDFALISINPALNHLVSPSMAHWGGPKGQWSSGVPSAVKHSGWGLVVGTGGTPRVGLGLSWAPAGLWTFAGAIVFGDSGSGANSGNNLAVGNITHILLTIPPRNAGTSITRIIQIAGLPLATCAKALPWPWYGCPL